MDKKHIYVIDLARVIATFFVLLTHATEAIYSFDVTAFNASPTHIQIPGIGLFIIGRLGVPIFMFITGYLMLDRTYDNKSIGKLWGTRLIGFLFTTEIWIVLYHIFSAFIFNRQVNLSILLRQMCFFRVSDANHLWYMGQLVGVYLILPFLSLILKQITKTQLSIILAVSFLYLFVHPMCNIYLSVQKGEAISPYINANYFCGIYGVMIILGWMIKKGIFDTVPSGVFLISGLVSYTSLIAFCLYAFSNGVRYTPWYDCGLLLICAASLFILALRIKTILFPNIIRWLSSLTFGVYLLHKAIEWLIHYKIDLRIQSHIQYECVLLIGMIVLSNLLVFILSRNKKLANILFCMNRQ